MEGLAHIKPQQKRKFGFKESREDLKKRLQSEKKEKWRKKLSQEDHGKLSSELKCLCKAVFLSPPQKERKRLVEKMLREMNSEKQTSIENENEKKMSIHEPEDEEKEDDFSVVYENFRERRNDFFVPRSLRKEETKNKSLKEVAEVAEKEILETCDQESGDLDDFLNNL